MAVAVIQEFPIDGDDRTTANYDRVQEALGARANPPAGGLVHTAGFDEEAGVFRIFDVWESQEAWDAFLNDRLMPIVRPLMEQGGRPPATRVYQLHDFMGRQCQSAGRVRCDAGWVKVEGGVAAGCRRGGMSPGGRPRPAASAVALPLLELAT